MEHLQVTKDSAQQAYKQADSGGKTLLANLFGRQHFFFSIEEWEAYIMAKVKSFEDACAETGEDLANTKFHTGTPDEIAYKRIKVLVKALNPPDWKCEWTDGNQRKCYPWFEYKGTGFRFGGSGYDIVGTYSGGGSRLRLCSEKLSNYLGTQFIDLFNQYLN